MQNRVMLARYRGRTTCTECGGGRLRQEAMYVKVGGLSLPELTRKSIGELNEFFEGLELTEHQEKIAESQVYRKESWWRRANFGNYVWPLVSWILALLPHR